MEITVRSLPAMAQLFQYCHLSWRLRSDWLPVSLAGFRLPLAAISLLALLLGGCGASESLLGGNSISVLVEQIPNTNKQDRASAAEGLERMIDQFRGFNPDVNIKVMVVDSDRLGDRLDHLYRNGLVPDLLALKRANLLPFYQKHWIQPVMLTPEERANWRIGLLKPFEISGGILALPVVLYPKLACFNTSKLARSPETFAELIQVGRSQISVGMEANIDDLLWALSGFGNHSFQDGDRPTKPGSVLAFLEWIRLANLQPDISFVGDENILRKGLADGNFAWIPCQSRFVPSLKRALGPRLGIAPLPAGPVESVSYGQGMRSWSFGSQSRARQQFLARKFVLFSVNTVQQRSIALQTQTSLPVNPYLSMPFKAYPDLEIIEQAGRVYAPLSLAAAARLAKVAPKLQLLTDEVLSGASAPAAVAPAFESLLKR